MNDICKILSENLPDEFGETEDGKIYLYLPLSNHLADNSPLVKIEVTREVFDYVKRRKEAKG
jgi:hypothetical protein